MNFKKISVVLMSTVLIATMAAGCGNSEKNVETNTSSESGEIKTFTAFMAVPGIEIPDDNRMMNKIAEKIGAKADVTWLTGQTAAERIGVMIAGGEYPDFIDGGDGTAALIEAGGLIPLEGYFDEYPNIKNYLSETDWNKMRKDDGHIYIIPQFGVIQGKDMAPTHNDEAFWIQKRVLKWDNFPEIKTVDQYFGLIDRYLEANPTTDDGQNNIGFEILSEDWRYFCLENPPQFVAGYPNDGCAIVDPETKEVSVYDKIPEAKEYFKKINEEYNKGTVDPETFTLSYDQYIAKISSGRVLGMVDQGWQFQTATDSLNSQGLDDRTYVPLDVVLDENTTPQYFAPSTLNNSNGLGISVSCKDIDGALKFMNDLLSPEVTVMEKWGEEGIDYSVDANGVFSRNQEQRDNAKNTDWINKNICKYDYFPHYTGLTADGKNAIDPAQQPDEFYATLTDIDKEVLDAYGYKTWTDFMTPVETNSAWFPLYSATNAWTADTAYGIAKQKMSDVKHEWLPKVIMSKDSDFDKTWEEYMSIYDSEVDYKAYEEELTKEVAKRIAVADGDSE